MRKFLMMTVLAGAAAVSSAHAAPATALALPGTSGSAAGEALADGALVQPVQYYEDWRHREFRQREAFERFRRHEEWRRFREAREGYGRGGYGGHGGYGHGGGGYYR